MGLSYLLTGLMLALVCCSAVQARPQSQTQYEYDIQSRDLSRWNPDETPLLELNGTWSLSGEGFPETVEVPGTWRQLLGHQASVGQHARYFLRLQLPQELVGEPLMLDFSDMRPYFRARANGQLIAQSGTRVAENYRKTSRAWSHLAFTPQQTELNLEIFVENVGEFGNGLRSAPSLGRAVAVEQKAARRQILIHLLLGSTLIFFLYHGLLYWQRREPELLYFMGLCCTTLLYYSFYFAHLPEVLWHDLSFEISFRLVRLAIYPFCYLGFAYFHCLFGVPHYARIHPWVLGLTVLGTLSIFLPTYWVGMVLLMYYGLALPLLLYCSGLAWQVWRKGAGTNRAFFYSVAFLMLCLFMDVLFDMRWIQSGFWLPWGSMGFLLGQAMFLSQRFHQDFLQVKTLKSTLQLTNQNLEIQIAERTEHLRIQAQELAHMGSFKEKLTRMVAHDLGAPLSTILYFTNQRVPNAEQSRLLYQAAQEARRMVQSLSDLKSLEKEAFVVNKQEVVLSPLIEAVLKQMAHWQELKTLHILHASPDDLRVFADPELLFRVLQNLIYNACEHAPEGATLQVKAQRTPENVTVLITDDGLGISPAVLDTIFTVKSANQRGLGLPFCKLALEAQGGHIEIDSGGQGTQVRVTLPYGGRSGPEIQLSPSEKAALLPVLQVIDSLPFYMFSEIERHLERAGLCLSEKNQAYIQALQTDLQQADEPSYHKRLEHLKHACTSCR